MSGINFETVRRITLTFPNTQEGTSYGTPAIRANKKFFLRMHDNGEDLVVKVGEVGQGFLMDAEPEIFYITDHYRGSSLVLVRLSKISASALHEVLEHAWRKLASKRDLAVYNMQAKGYNDH